MGAYLAHPVKDKTVESGYNSELRFGACAMQGWRTQQEDAHNCILDFEDGTSFFAVYDGHGGHEVAQYTAKKFPQMLRETEMWSKNRIGQALEDAFLKFDESLIDPQVVEELKEIAGTSKKDDDYQNDEDGDEDEEDKARLLEESHLPISDVLSRYGIEVQVVSEDEEEDLVMDDGDSPRRRTIRLRRSAAKTRVCVKKVGSKNVKSKKGGDALDVNEKSDAAATKPKSSNAVNGQTADRLIEDDHEPSSEKSIENGNVIAEPPAKRNKLSTPDANGTKLCVDSSAVIDNKEKNGVVSEQIEPDSTQTADTVENHTKKNQTSPVILKSSDKTEAKNELIAAVETESSNDDEEGEDEEYAESSEESSDNDDEESEEADDEKGANVSEEWVEAKAVWNGDDEEKSEYDDCPVPPDEKPGVSSGTTACVVVVRRGTVYVANAGDSRCVLCRGDRAVDLSADHKPEDDVEWRRILAAGGKVTSDGRINGGLNLSRAFGDHFYKSNSKLPLKDQMISCLPDIRVETLLPEDRFLVIACDGIWNAMSSEMVIDFINSRLDKGMAPTKICEEICDTCLADDTMGDGTGCDNMTMIIVDLKHNKSAASVAAAVDGAQPESTEAKENTAPSEPPNDTSAAAASS